MAFNTFTKAFLFELLEHEEISADDFQIAVQSLVDLGVTEDEFYDGVGITQTTLIRWYNGESAPVPMARHAVVRQMLKLLQNQT